MVYTPSARAALVPFVIALVATPAEAAPFALEPRKKTTPCRNQLYLTPGGRCVKKTKCPKGTIANTVSRNCQAINKAPVPVSSASGTVIASTVYVPETVTVVKQINVAAPTQTIKITLTEPVQAITKTLDAIVVPAQTSTVDVTVTEAAPPAETKSITQTLSISATETITINIENVVSTTLTLPTETATTTSTTTTTFTAPTETATTTSTETDVSSTTTTETTTATATTTTTSASTETDTVTSSATATATSTDTATVTETDPAATATVTVNVQCNLIANPVGDLPGAPAQICDTDSPCIIC